MKKFIYTTITTLLLSTVVLSPAYASDSWFDWLINFDRQKGVNPVADENYNEECGSCHFPYQPGFLPEASWRKLLDAKALEDHFGENAELDDETRLPLLEFLVANSADKSLYKRSRKVISSLKEGQAPLRITEVPYIKRKHHEIPEKLIKQEKVKSLSYCDACHMKAKEGIFDDDTVKIPNHGYWTW